MKPSNLLKTGWWCFELPGYRNHPQLTTYSLFSYEELPPLEAPAGEDFQWLQAEPVHQKWSLAANGYPDGSIPDLGRLPELVAEARIDLPPAFITFMQSVSLHQRLRSCTGCFLELSDHIVRTTQPAPGVLIHFLSDQQSCLQWYLYAGHAGDHCVTVSGELYGYDLEPYEPRRDDIDLLGEDIWLCAPSFVEFIYRFWIENEIFFSVVWDKLPPTPLQAAYLDHYLRLKQQ